MTADIKVNPKRGREGIRRGQLEADFPKGFRF